VNFKTGVIQNINLKDSDINEIYSIDVLISDSSGLIRKAYPLDTNIKRFPINGEVVLLFPSIGVNANRATRDSRLYYMNPISIQLNPNNNALPPIIAPSTSQSNNNDYDNTSSGTPNVANTDDTSNDLGEGFIEESGVSPLQPFLGDVLIEGRFGHSIRFGYTPSTTQTTKRPAWSSSNESDPITIISNGRAQSGEYNKFTIENIDDDLSSIWLTASQRVRIQTSQRNIGSGVDVQSQFDNPSIILSSDRILLNSKSDYIILSADKSVNICTPNWAMDMDELFTQLKTLIDEVIKLNENVEKAHDESSSIAQSLSTSQVITQLGNQPLINFASFIQSKTKSESNKIESTTIKQNIQTILQNINNMEQ
tara:strand:- start:60540 stop:61640 length:1101 start_codon:yes stop_codon:yes gene_type:complete